MPEIKVTDEKGITHVFPDGSTPEMIAKAMKVKYNGPAPASTPPANTGDLRASTQRERFLDPNFYPVGAKGEGVGENLHNIAQRAGVGVFQFADALTHPRQTVAGILSSVLPEPVVKGVNKVVDLENKIPGAHYLTTKLPEGTENPIKGAYDAVEPGGWTAAGNVAPTVGQILAGGAFGEAGPAIVSDVRGIPKAAGSVGDALRSKYGPRDIPVGDEKVPVTVGEANPESAAGRKQLSLKRSGAGAAKFEKVEKAQQEAAKNVIKKTAQRASGQIGPLQAEPGAVVNDAATASFAQAAPLYDNLDASLKTVPDTLQNVSKMVDTAIGRARKLGVNFAEDGGDISKIHPDKDGAIQWGGSKISKASHPDRWAKLVDEGIIDESGNGTPIKAYRNVISQLKSMLRASSDGATRHALSKEIETMTRGMDTALEGTGLEKTWHEADRLWRQGKARIDVSKAISDATKGPRAAITPPGMSEVPTEMQGGSLVKALDKLQDDGTLEDAFTPEEGKNLRQSALILDRIQKTSTGTGYGESGSRSRAIAHILRGAPGPMVGAGVGGGIGLLTGHGFIAGAEAGGFAGFIVQSIGERALVNVMTKLDGVRALDAVADAKTPAEVNSAMTKLSAVAAASAPKKRPGDLLRQAQ